MPRVKNYVAKTIYARVIGYGPEGKYAHIFVPSHWMNKEVTLIEYKNGKTKGRAQVKKFTMNVRNYNKMSCHIPLSSVFVGDVFEVTLDDHRELMHEMFIGDSSR